MAQYRDYQNPTVGQLGCTYSRLGNVYSGRSANGNVDSMANYVVPKFCPNGPGPNYPPRYDTLSHGQAYNCGGYFDVSGAYPYADCTSCKAGFTTRPCKGNIAGACKPAAPATEGYRRRW